MRSRSLWSRLRSASCSAMFENCFQLKSTGISLALRMRKVVWELKETYAGSKATEFADKCTSTSSAMPLSATVTTRVSSPRNSTNNVPL